MQSNVIICKTPKNQGLHSNLLDGEKGSYRSGEFYMDFTKINSVDEIIERLHWMESRGYHLTNDRGSVYRSESIAYIVESLKELYDPDETSMYQYTLIKCLTRSGNLRSQVVYLLDEHMISGETDEEE